VNQIVKDIGIVKSIVVQKQRKLLIATSGKDIVMWDLVSLNKVGEYKGLNEIKCL